MTDKIRLLIVDDHTLFREGLSSIFHSVEDVEVVGEAASGIEAIKKSQELMPDVILMDIQMDDMNGIEATKQILETLPDTRIIMLTMLEESDSLFAAMSAGAKGYVLKGADKDDVLKTIRAVMNGDVLFGQGIATQITNFFQNIGDIIVTQNSSFEELTERELEVLNLIAQGLNNHEIAQKLHIASKTVSNHVSNIFNKLQVTDRAQAIIKAREAGLGKDKREK